MEESKIISERKGRVQIIRLNRPQRSNSFTPAMLGEFHDALIDAQENDKVRVIILTGTGSNFTTGMDTGLFSTGAYKPSERRDVSARMERMGAKTARLLMQGKLSIAAINGRSMGMGVVYALASDFRYAVEGSTFKMPEVDSSIYPGANCVTMMVQQLGPMKTKEILMTCRSYTAQDFKEIGVLNDVMPADGFMDKMIEFGKELARKNQKIIRLLKLNVNHVAYLKSIEEGSRLEAEAFLETFKPDLRESVKRLVGKFGIDEKANW
ncbi:MAG: enoyl-CoA hydratase/isomerase family protein [Promethearchaeota archaeon]